ncbi:cilia- and flagella-associated protein 251 isoform X2 [Poeciliopsis prolifica]|uniref:cilia- and flagella-associated protein 251 isoform X2 n=1 Tax=Poeciliopsis prolifica TaxID=188132 RepID=UPI0024132C4E|nr:cilia- and flagella-associated protein 251 isoform X2 [Poeciliopsis prolifica]
MSASSTEQPTSTSANEQQDSECAGEEENVHTTYDGSNMHGQSQVYTATQDTLFSKEAARPAMHVLSLERAFGMNPVLPIYSLQDSNQLIFLYISAHVGIIFNHTLNSQHILQGHSFPISCMCVSEDRRWIATVDGGSRNMLIIWDSYSGIPVNTMFECHPGSNVASAGFSSDTKYLVTLSNAEFQSVLIWDWTSGEQKSLCQAELNPKHGFQDRIIFNPNDNSQLLSGSKTHMLIYKWDSEGLKYFALNLKKVTPATDPDVFAKLTTDPTKSIPFVDLCLSRAVFHWKKPQVLKAIGSSILTWDISKNLVEQQTQSFGRIKTIHIQQEPITVLTITDTYIVTGDIDGNVRFYDENFLLVSWYTDFNQDPVVYISFSKELPNEKIEDDYFLDVDPLIIRNFIVSTINAKIIHLNTQTGVIQTVLQNDFDPLHALTCHPFQPAVAYGNLQGMLRLWDYNCKAVIGNRFFETEKQIQSITFDPKGVFLAVGFRTGAVYILDATTLQNNPEEIFNCIKDSIHLITFSHDSQYLATADAGRAVSLFRNKGYKDSLRQWTFVGRYRSHYKPIQDLLFGVQLYNAKPRLLSLGLDRQLVEYELEKSENNKLLLISIKRIEQSAVPRCMTWYPFLNPEEFLLVASDNYKIKLFNSTTTMCRKTLLGPTYGSPLGKIVVLPKSMTSKTKSRHLAFITNDMLGLQILPLDGNPYKSSALICHPTGVSTFSCSYDGKFVFTAGGSDNSALAWKVNLDVLDASAALSGENMEPFYSLIKGGRDGRFYKEMEDFFFYCQIRHQGTDMMKRIEVTTKIPLSEVPFLMRALGHFPTEQEIEDMFNEIKFSRYAETGKYVTDIDLEDFIKLYINHRPAFGLSSEELVQAFHVLGKKNVLGNPIIQKGDMIKFLQARGEHMTEEEVAECFSTLLGVNEKEEEEEEKKKEEEEALDEECTLGSVIPERITVELFTQQILGLPLGIKQRVRTSVKDLQIQQPDSKS